MADQDEWSLDANEVVKIAIVQPGTGSPTELFEFPPKFTYPLFDDKERIFGYKELIVKLRFAAHDLYPHVAISFDDEFKQVGDTKATDILGILKAFLPDYAFGKLTAYNNHIQNDKAAASFKPPGKLVESYTSKGRNFEIWSAELSDNATRVLLERMQIFISFFIEGGTPLDLDDEKWTLRRWRVFFVYEKLSAPTPNASPYSIVGYSTSYRFLLSHDLPSPTKKAPQAIPAQPPLSPKKTNGSYLDRLPSLAAALPKIPDLFQFPPDPMPLSALHSRARISQFLILPPHQGHSHGTHLYNAMVSIFLSDPSCLEITVEDPNEAFDDLRDYCDYNRLKTSGALDQIKLNLDIDPRATTKRVGVRVPTSKLLDKPLLESIRLKNKIAPRQFDRLVEMHLLSRIPPEVRMSGTARLTQRGRAADENDRAYYFWRLIVKQRIYKKNKDTLIQLDRAERIDKVEETLGDQAGDYERLLGNLEKRLTGEFGLPRRERKRKIIEDDDEDDSDEEEAIEENGGQGRGARGSSKRPRTDDDDEE